MQIHRFRGRTLYDALLRAREEHGEGAVVVGHEASPDGGVTVAVTGAEAGAALATVRARKKKGAVAPRSAPSRSSSRARGTEAQDVGGEGVLTAVRAGVALEGAARSTTTVPAQPRSQPQRPGADEGQPLKDPGLLEVRRRLERGGASRTLVGQTLRAVAERGARGTHAIDVAARYLGSHFRVAGSPRVSGATHVIAFVGPTGVGKTTTISKLAARLVRAGRSVAIATTDVHHPAGTAALHQHATELGVPVEEVRSAKELLTAVVRHSDADVLLLDTAGRSPLDASSVRGLGRVLERTSSAVSLTTYLVLPATSQKEALDEALRGFAPCAPNACVITKLDETQRMAGVLEFASFHDLDIAFFCNGQDRNGHLHRPKAAHFADLLLRGRLA